MSINIGNSKIGKIYVGSTAIGKVYKGSELMWESGLRLYAYKTTTESLTNLVLNVGGIGSNYPIISLYFSNNISPSVEYGKFTAISSTLGSSGSKITIDSNQYTYKNSINVNGTTIYIYVHKISTQFIDTYWWAWVLKGTTTNQSKVILSSDLSDGSAIPYPYSANSSQIKVPYSETAIPRYSTADITWK